MCCFICPLAGVCGSGLGSALFFLFQPGKILRNIIDEIHLAYHSFVGSLNRIPGGFCILIRTFRQKSTSTARLWCCMHGSMLPAHHTYSRCAYPFLLFGAFTFCVSASGCGTDSGRSQHQVEEPSSSPQQLISPNSTTTPTPKKGGRIVKWKGIDSGYNNETNGN